MKTIVSASRRTDIPAFYLDWLIQQIGQGFAEAENPVTRRPYRVSLRRKDVHSLVLWSKNFGPYLERRQAFSGYQLYFQFTINDIPSLEPAALPLEEKLRQMRELARLHAAEMINWRFDPLVFLDEGKRHNMAGFDRILEAAARTGIGLCTFSFATYYPKVLKRMQRAGLKIFDPPLEQKIEIACYLAEKAGRLGITLASCSMPPFGAAVKRGACIDGELLSRLAGEPCETRKDRSQRKECGCTISRDIGSYAAMPCKGNCLYCYCRPAGG